MCHAKNVQLLSIVCSLEVGRSVGRSAGRSSRASTPFSNLSLSHIFCDDIEFAKLNFHTY